jgi:hypothetical protein
MCTLGLKFFKDVGWVGIKNRDRNYIPVIQLIQHKNTGLMWDRVTNFSEGISCSGIAVLNAATFNNFDENQGKKKAFCQTGKGIKNALKSNSSSVFEIAELLIRNNVYGNTLIFSSSEAYILELSTKESIKVFVLTRINSDFVITNHGINLPWAGYQKGFCEKQDKKAESSHKRLELGLKEIVKCSQVIDLFTHFSSRTETNPQNNILRLDTGNIETTGQLLLIPETRSLHYRPIKCIMKNFQVSTPHFDLKAI